jgi:DNA-binding response OmpR family regulator
MDERKQLILFGDRDLGWSLPLRRRLSQRGFRVATVSSAQVLLEFARQTLPDLLVLGESLDELGGRLLAGLVKEESPATRIIRVLPLHDPALDEPGPTDNVLCTMTRRASPKEFADTINRVLSYAPRGTERLKAPLVVCVDDDPPFLNSLARLIRRQGCRVLTYSDPELALEELPLVEPDLLILDVLMPGLSGFEVLDEIRRYHRDSLPVVLLSALDSDEKIAQGRAHGAACYLTKPCAPETLLEIVHRLLARSGTDRKDIMSPGWVARDAKGPHDRSGERSSGPQPP